MTTWSSFRTVLPDGWHPEASYLFVDDVVQAIGKAKELAGEGTVAIAAGDVGGQALALGLVDEVAMDIVPVVFGLARGISGRSTASVCWRTQTSSSGVTACCTCATESAADAQTKTRSQTMSSTVLYRTLLARSTVRAGTSA